MRRVTQGFEWFLSHSILFASVMTATSFFTSHLFNTPLARFDSEYVSFFLGFFTVFHSLVGSKLFEGMEKKIETLRVAILTRNKAVFLVYRDVRIQPALTKWLRALSITIIVGAMITPFEDHLLGLPFVWGLFQIIGSFWATVIELDDPFNGKWNLEVPDTDEYEGWMTTDPNEFFSKPENQKAPVMDA